LNRRPIFDLLRQLKREWTRNPEAVLHPDEVVRFDDVLTLAENGGVQATSVGAEPVSSNLGRLAGSQGQDTAYMSPSPAAFELIKQFEGYAKARPDGGCEAYPDPASGGDPWTCGYGSTGPDVKRGTVWTKEQAEARLEADVRKFASGVAGLVAGKPTTQTQFDAMVSFAYNLGLGALRESTLLRKHRAGDYAGAAAEFARWNKAAGKVMAGLSRRRAAEMAMYGKKP
jgi:lysozyme